MHPVLCTNTHHDIIDLENHGKVRYTKTWISWKRNIIFLRNKKFFNLCLRWHILRSYRFLVEVTFELFKKYDLCCRFSEIKKKVSLFQIEYFRNLRSSRAEVFCRKSLRPATLLKRDFGTGVFLWVLRDF